MIGLADAWYKQPITDDQAHPSYHSYENICNEVVEDFFKKYKPCTFRLRPRTLLHLDPSPCVLRKNGHTDGKHRAKSHVQYSSQSGDFSTDFLLSAYAWDGSVLEMLKLIERDQGCPEWRDERTRGQAHRYIMLTHCRFFLDKDIFSNQICLCCLANPPEHKLHCGHTLCTQCVLDFGRVKNSTQIVVEACPLHTTQDTSLSASVVTTAVKTEPHFSGLRVLCLDGYEDSACRCHLRVLTWVSGGIRGIVELCLMEALETRLGIDLYWFFDLVVGTRYTSSIFQSSKTTDAF